jgi:hypothetical protein
MVRGVVLRVGRVGRVAATDHCRGFEPDPVQNARTCLMKCSSISILPMSRSFRRWRPHGRPGPRPLLRLRREVQSRPSHFGGGVGWSPRPVGMARPNPPILLDRIGLVVLDLVVEHLVRPLGRTRCVLDLNVAGGREQRSTPPLSRALRLLPAPGHRRKVGPGRGRTICAPSLSGLG